MVATRRRKRRRGQLVKTGESRGVASPAYQIKALTIQDPDFPILWPQLCARLKKVWEQYSPYVPAQTVLQEWLNAFSARPDVLHVGVITQDGTKVVGHWVATAEIYYGRGFVAIQQLAIDHPRITKQIKKQGMQILCNWIKHVNDLFRAENLEVRLEAVRFLTPHNPQFWLRWFPLKHMLTEYTLTFEVPSELVDEPPSTNMT